MSSLSTESISLTAFGEVGQVESPALFGSLEHAAHDGDAVGCAGDGVGWLKKGEVSVFIDAEYRQVGVWSIAIDDGDHSATEGNIGGIAI